jgi:histone chaperone ASF1
LYVGSAQDSSKDQILDEILVGPVPVGVNKFVLQADAPDVSKLAPEDLLGVTVVLVTCSYKEREFVRVGYYVNNEYYDPTAPPPVPGPDGELPPVQLPSPIPLQHIHRQLLADKPRVTKFPISWGDEDTTAAETQQRQMQQAAVEYEMKAHAQAMQNQIHMQEESNMGGVQAMAE